MYANYALLLGVSQDEANFELPRNLMHRLTARGLPPGAIAKVAILAWERGL